MFKSEYDKIIRENFDLSDRYTRQYIATLEDAGQEQLLNTLSSAMYDNIVAKVDEIDFGTIPMSRGDITKVEGFEKTMQCLDIIRRLVIEYKQSTGVVDVVISQDTVNFMKSESNFDVSIPKNAKMIMDRYNFLCLVIADETNEVAKFMYDGNSDFESISYLVLAREAKDKELRKATDLLYKGGR